MSQSILIVEDEIKLANLLADYFKQTEYQPHLIHHGDEVISWVKTHQPQAILLDIMLPGKNGIDLCKEIRQFSNVPILMVTAKVEEIDRLLGLELGADDYICKPFSPREVVARVKAVLRRGLVIENRDDTLQLDEHRFMVSFHQRGVSLTAVEFQLLKPLATKPERIFTREQLMQNMYSDHRIVNYRTIDSHIKKLRKKLADISQGKDWIQSVYGAGYRLVL
ncbi:response regulator receiver [Shewanella denitrificans OS217]|jgi:two-component system, OmpR family, response regulator BaeR|uniref:Response regulator receiver n=1 Tax=Shewanella denitrificans (strain OS217 / ATCC BAA-1090 / DSM 15013) TaxID=318161 RepID=Q12SP5_SHEDO|nr:response regulator [Shewanella denitrificans]ABE53531.1 response regulator receiver [Shewanella denitrificans OS217]